MFKVPDLVLCGALVISLSGCGIESPNAPAPQLPASQIGPGGGLQQQSLESIRHLSTGKFKKLTGEATGLNFMNDLQPQNMRKYLLNGAGLATGDFDNDGLVDVYAISQDGPNRLFRQTSPWQFEDVTYRAGDLTGGDYKGTGAAFVDVNNDGWLDLYACNIDGPNQLFINQKDGVFLEEANARGVQFQGATTMCAFADYDRDGDLDLYLVNNRILSIVEEQPRVKLRKIGEQLTVHPDFVEQYFLITGRVQEAGQKDCLYRNDGKGNFVDATDAAGIAGFDMGLSATWWDYDGDGWMDIYVANDLKSPDHLYQNQKDGTFRDVISETVTHTPWFSMGADAADINNDGMMDFLVADMSSTTHYKQKTTMGEMGNSAWFLTTGKPRQFMRNTLLVNTGSDRFQEAANLAGLDSTDWTWSVKFGDLDSDGLVDLFVTNGIGRKLNDSDAGTDYQKLMEAGDTEAARIEFLKPRKEKNLAYQNMGDLAFENKAQAWGVDHLGVSQGASLVDLDRDGDLDLLVNNMNEPLGIYRNEIAAAQNLIVKLQGTTSNRFGLDAKVTVGLGDLELVRYLTSARGFMSADDPVLHFGLGAHSKIDFVIVDWPSGIRQRFEGIDANQLLTITEGPEGQVMPPEAITSAAMFADASISELNIQHHERAYDDFKHQPLLPNKLSQLGPGIAWGDVDRDGREDCFIGGAAGTRSKLLLQTSPGQFQLAPGFQESRRHEDMGAVFFDVDRDGDLDLYVASGGYEHEPNSIDLRDRLYLNDGSGGFAAAPSEQLPDTRVPGSSVSAADFDRDGDLDLFVGTRFRAHQWPLAASSQLLRNDNGTLVDASSELAKPLDEIGLVTGSVWSDVDQDGWIDLLLTLEWGPVKILKNEKGVLVDATAAAGTADVTGWWNSITGGDIDNDGDIDFVALNFGLNTKYHGDKQHPVALYAGDFDKNGSLNLVEAEYEGDVCYPIRGRSCSAQAMPFLKDKFPTFREFALADVIQIYSGNSLDASSKFSANELQSVLLINDGSGSFDIQPLPRWVQISPGFGSVLQDFNGDGNLDLCIAQNFMQPQPETGQMDGGLGILLLGDGNGQFRSLTPNESGICVPGQGMALTVTDWNDDAAPDLLMSVNDDASQAWTNQSLSSPTAQRFRLLLQADAGNQHAVGSRVTVIRKNEKQVHEITAGSGYLSQSTPQVFLVNDANHPITSVTVNWPDGTEKDYPLIEQLPTCWVIKK
ncbi:MAG: FG-GAP-like repeat-containing protein [Rubripirellula sp.]|nr:FG-GAP-like repeat-containing protein [Rubripirellula sp.]